MVRGVVRRFMPALSVVAIVASLLALPVAVSGCSKNDPFVTRHCTVNDNPRVSADRMVYLEAKNHIYAGISSDRDAYLSRADDAVEGAYAVVNRIFAADGINLRIVPLLENDHRNDSVLNVTEFGSGSLTDPFITEMVGVHEGLSEAVGVHWSEWFGRPDRIDRQHFGYSAPAPCPSERCNWIQLIGVIRVASSVEEIGRILAYTFGAYFNLHAVSDPGNLFNGSDPGTLLTTKQRDTMWAAINTSYRTTLLALTCDAVHLELVPRMPNIKPVPAPPDTFTGKPTVVSRSG